MFVAGALSFFFPTVIICCFSSFNFVFALAYYSSQFVLCSFHICICKQHFNKFSFNQIVCDNSYMVVQLLCNMYKWTVLWTFCQFRFFFLLRTNIFISTCLYYAEQKKCFSISYKRKCTSLREISFFFFQLFWHSICFLFFFVKGIRLAW